MLSTRQLFFRHLAQTSSAPVALEIESASGCWLNSASGKRYFDLISGVSVSNTGHNNRQVIEAVKAQVDKHMHLMVFGEYIQNPQVKFAEMISGLLPENLDSVYFTNSGSESAEGAIKLARRYTGRYEIISFYNAYHGSTLGALSITGNESLKRAFRPLIPSVRFIEFNNSKSLEAISVDTACVFVEPIQGEAGVKLPGEGFLGKLRERCNETGALLVFDEIQTGFGRTGKMFAMDLYNVYPDIVLFAKGLGGGFPVGAFVASRNIMQALSHDPALGHITTFGGHPVSCAAGLASLNQILNEKLYLNSRSIGGYFKQQLVHPLINEVRGEGLLMAVEMESAGIVRILLSKLLELGVVSDWFLFNEKCVRISPPLIISREEAAHVCKLLLEAMDKVKKEL